MLCILFLDSVFRNESVLVGDTEFQIKYIYFKHQYNFVFAQTMQMIVFLCFILNILDMIF